MPSRLNPQISEEVREYQVPGRTDSAAFLAWFIVNFFRVDPDEARDSICDSVNDKGIDGILVDDQTAEILLFQAKWRSGDKKTQGDNDLRNFAGASKWFRTPDTVEDLIRSTASPELKSLVMRCDVSKRLSEGYSPRLVFVSSLPFDSNARDYINMQDTSEVRLSGWGAEELDAGLARFSRPEKIMATHFFDLTPRGFYRERVSDTVEVIIAPLRAVQIAQLQGISDKSLFARNVRFGLGETRVNRDIKSTVLQRDEHRNFILYHNGITILCDNFRPSKRRLKIENYSIVNGCQSLITFFDNRNSLSDELLVLAKIVKVGPRRSQIADDITYYNNNQNSISMKDLRSNDRIQTGLQSQFREYFGDKVFYAIKRGEDVPELATVIDNSIAAQILLSFSCEEPENAHQKYKLFDQNYSRIFHRDIQAEQIYLAFLLYRALEETFGDVEDPLIRDYKLAKFFLLYVLKLFLKDDELGKRMVSDPKTAVLKHGTSISEAAKKLAKILVLEFNFLVETRKKEQEGFFDYKNDLKSRVKVKGMSDELVKAYKKGLVRHPEERFSAILTNDGEISAETFFN